MAGSGQYRCSISVVENGYMLTFSRNVLEKWRDLTRPNISSYWESHTASTAGIHYLIYRFGAPDFQHVCDKAGDLLTELQFTYSVAEVFVDFVIFELHSRKI